MSAFGASSDITSICKTANASHFCKGVVLKEKEGEERLDGGKVGIVRLIGASVKTTG